MMFGDPRLPQRFWNKVAVTDDGCWTWTAGLRNGCYGGFSFEGKTKYAHRIAYESLVGPIPDGLTIDHLCRNTKCQNPEHMEPVTHRENRLRAVPFMDIDRESYPCGHPRTDENSYLDRESHEGWSDNYRCRECTRAKNLERYHAKRKAAQAAA